MEPGTQKQETEQTPTFPGQGEPGTDPGQQDQPSQQQSEEGLQPIPVAEKYDGDACIPEEQAEQNK